MQIESNYKMKAHVTDISMFLYQFQLTFKHFIHGNLDMTCQGCMKTINLVRFIQRHKDIKLNLG